MRSFVVMLPLQVWVQHSLTLLETELYPSPGDTATVNSFANERGVGLWEVKWTQVVGQFQGISKL